MDQAFWMARWSEGRIGFHEGAPNRFLARWAAELGPFTRVLVPLCGKAEDLAHLAARGGEVVGVELAEQAVRAFFDEHGLTPEIEERAPLRIFRAGDVTLACGDVFDVTAAHVGVFDAVYDRAALVALPEPTRRRYVDHVASLAPGARGLLVSFEYPEGALSPPPFSVDGAEVEALFGAENVRRLEEAPAEGPSARTTGGNLKEACWAIRLRDRG